MLEKINQFYENLKYWQQQLVIFSLSCVGVLVMVSLLVAGFYVEGDDIIKLTSTDLYQNKLLSTCDKTLTLKVRERDSLDPDNKAVSHSISVDCNGYVVGDIYINRKTTDFPIYSDFVVKKFDGYEISMPFHSTFSTDMYLLIQPQHMKKYNKQMFLQQLGNMMTWLNGEIHSENEERKVQQDNYDSWK